jgi:hypothetical protein
MFDWFGKMFASDKVLEKGLGIIEKAGDALFYTEEEEANDTNLNMRHKDRILVNWIEASKGSNIARRFIAVLVSLIWSFLFVFSWLTTQLAIFSDTEEERIKLMTEANEPFLTQSSGAMMLVLAFYFAAPYMGGVVKSALGMFAGNKTDSSQK